MIISAVQGSRNSCSARYPDLHAVESERVPQPVTDRIRRHFGLRQKNILLLKFLSNINDLDFIRSSAKCSDRWVVDDIGQRLI